MKLREEQIRTVCETILSRWKEKGMIRPKAPEPLLLEKMIGEVVDDFRREEALDREVHALLDRHSREMAASRADSRVLFQKIKERLARERKIVL
ncbi:MAG: hypothetical protein Kow00128_16870 [Deltaproteobacteria bacterium]